MFCDTGGLTTRSFIPSNDNVYYLVVPRLTNREGHYGMDSSNVARPVGASICMFQSAADCF